MKIKRGKFATLGIYSNFIRCDKALPPCGIRPIEKDKAEVVGFPNTMVDPIDEAALLLKDRFQVIADNPCGYHIWTFHFPQKGDEADLLYWHSLKAKPYLDAQALLISACQKKCQAEKKKQNNLVTRVFIFPKPQSILDLTLNAFMTIYEQLQIGIECYYTCMTWFADDSFLENDVMLISPSDAGAVDLIRVLSSDREIPYGAKFCTCSEHSWSKLPEYHKKYLENVFIPKEHIPKLKPKVREKLISLHFRFEKGFGDWEDKQKREWDKRKLGGV